MELYAYFVALPRWSVSCVTLPSASYVKCVVLPRGSVVVVTWFSAS